MAATCSKSQGACLASGERVWPVPGLAATLPVACQRAAQRIAVEAAHIEDPRRLPPRTASLDQFNNAHAQIVRIAVCH